MKEQTPPERKITLGGKTYPVRLSLSVLRKAQSKASSNLTMPSAWLPLNPTDLQAVLWAVLGANEKGDLSYDSIGDQLVPSKEMYDIAHVIHESWDAGFAKIDEEPEAPFTQESEGGGPEPASISDSLEPSTTT